MTHPICHSKLHMSLFCILSTHVGSFHEEDWIGIIISSTYSFINEQKKTDINLSLELYINSNIFSI